MRSAADPALWWSRQALGADPETCAWSNSHEDSSWATVQPSSPNDSAEPPASSLTAMVRRGRAMAPPRSVWPEPIGWH